MKKIYYLTPSPNQELNGLVFPEELPENYYTTGVWVIAEKNRSDLESEYRFDAVHENRQVVLTLQRLNQNSYF
jgi:hypothetical protein